MKTAGWTSLQRTHRPPPHDFTNRPMPFDSPESLCYDSAHAARFPASPPLRRARGGGASSVRAATHICGHGKRDKRAAVERAGVGSIPASRDCIDRLAVEQRRGHIWIGRAMTPDSAQTFGVALMSLWGTAGAVALGREGGATNLLYNGHDKNAPAKLYPIPPERRPTP